MSSGFNRKSSIRGLVTTRRVGEQVIINHGELVIEVVAVKGKAVRLCFQASKDISIERGEKITDPVPSIVPKSENQPLL